MAIVLEDVGSGYNLSTLNNNFTKIETELNEKVLRREIDGGEANEMNTHLDYNAQRGVNVADAIDDQDIPSYKQVVDLTGGIPALVEEAEASAIAAAVSEVNALASEDSSAVHDANALDSANSAALSAEEADGYVSTSEIEVLERVMNVDTGDVIYASDLVTVLTTVKYIFDKPTNTMWRVPNNVGAGETIVSVSTIGVLTTNVTTYSMLRYNPQYGELMNARTWVPVHASRDFDVTYTNTEEYPIDVAINIYNGGEAVWSASFIIDFSSMTTVHGNASVNGDFVFTIPSGSTYQLTDGTGAGKTILVWKELR